MMPLVVIGALAKMFVSAALTVRTRLWWLPGVGAIGGGVALAQIASPGLGTFAVALGLAALATTRVVRKRAQHAQSTRSDGF